MSTEVVAVSGEDFTATATHEGSAITALLKGNADYAALDAVEMLLNRTHAEAKRLGVGEVVIDLDRIVRPGAVVSGNVTFSDGVAGKWALDQHGRLMLDTSQKGYQPSPADVQSFQHQLQAALQRHGF